MKQNKRHRGSVLLLVIGLLTIIAMLGSMLLLVSRLDRQTSQAMADTAPQRHVAESVLDRLLANRVADLYINASNVIYGNCNADPSIAERQMIDYPAEASNGVTSVDPNQWFDSALASIERDNSTPRKWPHVSHMSGVSATFDTYNFNTVDPNVDPNLVVDTDGDSVSDAYLFDTGLTDRQGNKFFAAVRMIDAAGLLNVNIANTTRDANAVHVMDASDCNMAALLANAGTVASSRSSGLYDMGDMLALGHLSDPNVDPNTVVGRLATVGNLIATKGSFNFTTVSSSKTLSPLWTYRSGATQFKQDPNPLASDANMYSAFRAMLQAYYPTAPLPPDSNSNQIKAAQLVVNLKNYLNVDPNAVIRLDVNILDSNVPANTYVYGVARHPFVSKVFWKKTSDADANTSSISAVELINPYVNTILLDNYSIQGGTSFTGKSIPGNGGRFLISDSSVQTTPTGDPNMPDPASRLVASLALDGVQQIIWTDPNGGGTVCVDQTPALTMPPPSANSSRWMAAFRNDVLSTAGYSVESYRILDSNTIVTDPNYSDPSGYDYTLPSGPKMGLPNPFLPTSGTPTPVYVRNGPMISLGDMMRILTVGPAGTVSLSTRLTNIDPNDRQLVPNANVPAGAFPAVPLGCAVSEYFNLLPPDPNYNIQGQININTAPRAVLMCLPGIASLSITDANTMVGEIIAYRDKGVGTKNYSDRAGVTGIANLRPQPGFACAGEVAIPLHEANMSANNNYNSNKPPDNYAVDPNGYDDGLVAHPSGDPIKYYTLYSWLANQVTVRSNVYIAFIRVQVVPAGRAAPLSSDPYRRYVAVIDRSNCTTAATKPRVLLFTELK
jgi:hypothetical protein